MAELRTTADHWSSRRLWQQEADAVFEHYDESFSDTTGGQALALLPMHKIVDAVNMNVMSIESQSNQCHLLRFWSVEGSFPEVVLKGQRWDQLSSEVLICQENCTTAFNWKLH